MWQTEFTNAFKDADTAERKTILSYYSEKTGYSRQSLYRIARACGFNPGRKRRDDKGYLRCGLTEDQVEFLASILHVTGRENKGPIMPVERAIQIAEDNGEIERGQVSPHTLNRILRERQTSKRHLKSETPHIKMRSLHPNHVHEFDVSVCIQFYMKNGNLGFMDEREFYKNKPDNFKKIKERILRYLLVDHFSGTFYFRYYNTTGETQANLWDFLKEAWSSKQDGRFPFCGVPSILLMDTGAANTSKAIIQFLERLDVNIPKGMPYNPRRQGAVESTHKIIEEWFESALRIQPASSDEEMNEWARDFMVWHNATQNHTRHGMPRTQCWMLITKEQLREIPPEDILQDLFANPEEDRKVDGTYAISYRGNEYNLKHVEGLFRGAKVKVILKPFKWPLVDVIYNEKLYEAKPLESLPAHLGAFRSDAAIIGEEYKSVPETLTMQAKKRFENMAYGEEKKKDAIPFEGLRVFGHHADKIGNIAFIKKKGTPIEVDRSIAEKEISFTEFLKRLIQTVGPISRELNQSLRGIYGESISIADADEILRQAQNENIEEVMRNLSSQQHTDSQEKKAEAM